MKVLHTLTCFFFLSLQDEHTGLVSAMNVYTAIKGGDVTVNCSSSRSDIAKFFCKQECEEKDILIRTTDVRAQRGRYSIEWKNKGDFTGEVFVTITQLTKSDSGLYRCGFNESGHSSNVEIRIIVVDALLDGSPSVEKNIFTRTGRNVVAACFLSFTLKWKFFCKEECYDQNILVRTTGARVQNGRYSIEYIEGSSSGGTLYVSISQLTKSDSGLYRCRPDRLFMADVYQEFNLTVTDYPITSEPNFQNSTIAPYTFTSTATESSGSSGVLLYVTVAIVVIVIIVGLVLMIVCIQRSSKLKGLRSRGHSGGTNMEIPDYENCPPVSPCEDSTYQSLDLASRDQDQTYATITHTHHTHDTDSNLDSGAVPRGSSLSPDPENSAKQKHKQIKNA